jgi:plastocyanin
VAATKFLRTAVCFLVLAPVAVSQAQNHAIAGQVVGADGKGIAQAIVFIQDPLVPSKPVPQPAVMDQFNKTFVPGVLPVVVGTQVRFPNRDQIRHHVYSFSRAKNFELPLYKGEEAPPVLFDKVGVVKIGCNIHDWMSAIILVLPNPHYATADENGRFTLSGLPAGEYSLTAWHAQGREKPEDIAQRVRIAGGDVEVHFALTLAPVRARPATRGARWDQ